MNVRCFVALAVLGCLSFWYGSLKAGPTVGWHMLTPPLDSTGVRPDLPLKQWKLSQQEFQNRDACMRYRESYLAAFSKELNEKIDDATWVAKHVKQIADHTECISTDDPRFPGDLRRWWSQRSRQNIQPQP
jgi:hypothetical protein